MKKIIICVILIFCIGWPAESSYIGYTNKKCYVYKNPSTNAAKVSLLINTKVYVMGTSGSFYKVLNSKKSQKGYILKEDISKNKTAADLSWKSRVQKLDWSVGQNALRRSGHAYLYDIKKGQRIRVKRLGGTNHMDLEPATSSDTSKLKKVCGGKYSWQTYPVILQTDGKYIAASINIKPHGSQSLKYNRFKGHFCLHLVNSRTHGTGLVNEEHQRTIEKAYEWAQR